MNNVQTGSDVAEALLKSEIERLSNESDRLHRERDSFQQQCSVMAEENARLEQDSKRLEFLLTKGILHSDFAGNFYVTVNKGGLPYFFFVDLSVLLDEYINDYWDTSHGEETPVVIKMLRDYADKIEADLIKRRSGV